jgi:hypothetical protein
LGIRAFVEYSHALHAIHHTRRTRYGSLGDTGPRDLRKSATHLNKFEAGHEDVFTIEAVDLGVLERVTIGHDNHGIGASWYVRMHPTFVLCDLAFHHICNCLINTHIA